MADKPRPYYEPINRNLPSEQVVSSKQNDLTYNGIFPGLPAWSRPKNGTRCYYVSFSFTCLDCHRPLAYCGDVIPQKQMNNIYDHWYSLTLEHGIKCFCGTTYYDVDVDLSKTHVSGLPQLSR